MDQMPVRKVAAGFKSRIMICETERLWTAEELGAYLGLSPRTIVAMSSKCPDRLPPRVKTMHLLRWIPSVCQRWVEGAPVVKRGRPARVPIG